MPLAEGKSCARAERQRAAAKALLLNAVDGEIEVIIPQFVVFEISSGFQTTSIIISEGQHQTAGIYSRVSRLRAD